MRCLIVSRKKGDEGSCKKVTPRVINTYFFRNISTHTSFLSFLFRGVLFFPSPSLSHPLAHGASVCCAARCVVMLLSLSLSFCSLPPRGSNNATTLTGQIVFLPRTRPRRRLLPSVRTKLFVNARSLTPFDRAAAVEEKGLQCRCVFHLFFCSTFTSFLVLFRKAIASSHRRVARSQIGTGWAKDFY